MARQRRAVCRRRPSCDRNAPTSGCPVTPTHSHGMRTGWHGHRCVPLSLDGPYRENPADGIGLHPDAGPAPGSASSDCPLIAVDAGMTRRFRGSTPRRRPWSPTRSDPPRETSGDSLMRLDSAAGKIRMCPPPHLSPPRRRWRVRACRRSRPIAASFVTGRTSCRARGRRDGTRSSCASSRTRWRSSSGWPPPSRLRRAARRWPV